MPELPAPDDGKILQKLRRRYSTHLLLLAFVGIAAGVALGYTGSANWVILFLPCVWAVLTCRDTGMGKPAAAVYAGAGRAGCYHKADGFF